MRGYVYLLVNSSLPGLIKIGMTARSPNERAQELSSATGVPTPFIVAYEQECEDCEMAEALVHERLSAYRHTTNREFFTTNTSDAVRAILEACAAVGGSEGSPSTSKRNNVARELYDEGEAVFFGRGETLQDKERGLALLEKAAALGSAEAHLKLGLLYTKQFPERALPHLTAAARADPEAYTQLAEFYALSGHKDNFAKCCSAFLRGMGALDASDERFLIESREEAIYQGLVCMMDHAQNAGWPYPEQEYVQAHAHEILAAELMVWPPSPKVREWIERAAQVAAS